MNELQRLHYLSSLGIDTYMPRWQLPFAPTSVACEMPIEVEEEIFFTAATKSSSIQICEPENSNTLAVNSDVKNSQQVSNLIDNIFEVKTVSAPRLQPIGAANSAANILAELGSKPVNIDAFSLSIWRPIDGVMIIDSRNSALALPTELLLNNILLSLFSNQSLKPNEEILRWPMIENSFAKRTASDACTELQTWLSVQHEIRPIGYLWLMGSNAADYLLPDQTKFTHSLFQSAGLADSKIQALILPSLNEILQSPLVKKKLFAAIRHYHSTSI